MSSKQTAVLICPGRGTYNSAELGYLARHHSTERDLMARFDAYRTVQGQSTLSALDGASRFTASEHTRGDQASPLIYACSYLDAQVIARDRIEIVAITGNSLGWYSALACAGALGPLAGLEVVNTMGTLMQEHLIGGQLVYPFTDENWQPIPGKRAQLEAKWAEINSRADHHLALSIDLGGMVVLAGNQAGLDAFEAEVPKIDGRFPLRLKNHAAFHTALQEPVAAMGRTRLPATLFQQPDLPLIDGRGHIWWPGTSPGQALWDYTLGQQVVEPYDFTKAITHAAREFAPDLFIVTGPGTTLGGAVAQALILANWRGMANKADFKKRQDSSPLLVAMGMDEQRTTVAKDI